MPARRAQNQDSEPRNAPRRRRRLSFAPLRAGPAHALFRGSVCPPCSQYGSRFERLQSRLSTQTRQHWTSVFGAIARRCSEPHPESRDILTTRSPARRWCGRLSWGICTIRCGRPGKRCCPPGGGRLRGAKCGWASTGRGFQTPDLDSNPAILAGSRRGRQQTAIRTDAGPVGYGPSSG